MMSGADYRMVAAVIADARDDQKTRGGWTDRVDAVDAVAEQLAVRFEEANFYFDRRLFLQNAGVAPD